MGQSVVDNTFVQAMEERLRLAAWTLTRDGKSIFTNHAITQVEHPADVSRLANIFGEGFLLACTKEGTYFCAPDIVDVIERAAEGLPDWTLSKDLLPTGSGFVWLGRPIIMPFPHTFVGDEQIDRSKAHVHLHGFTWAINYVGDNPPGRPGKAWVTYNPELIPSKATQFSARVHINCLLAIYGPAFSYRQALPMQHYAIDVGATLRGYQETVNAGANEVAAWNAFDEMFMRVVGSFLLFINQELFALHNESSPRATRRRAAAVSIKLPDAPAIETNVHVVMLRRRAHETHAANEHNEPVEWSCQWIVRGHWRQQYYPTLAQHRPKWIAPYIKGPEDRPLKPPKETVFAVVR